MPSKQQSSEIIKEKVNDDKAEDEKEKKLSKHQKKIQARKDKKVCCRFYVLLTRADLLTIAKLTH